MTKQTTDEDHLVVFFLMPEFTMLAFTSAIETLRLANRALGGSGYRWRVASTGGEGVTASCGLSIAAQSSIAEERLALGHPDRADLVIVCSGQNVSRYYDRSAGAWLRECRQRGVVVGGVCTGSYTLAKAGLLDHKRCTIHWENYPQFSEVFPQALANTSVYEIDGGIYTCAGGTATFDMMLDVVRKDYGDDTASAVCAQALIDRVRLPSEPQRAPLSVRLKQCTTSLLRAVSRMEKALDQPVAITAIARDLKMSRRQLERLFRTELGSSPAQYYTKMRIERARLLLKQSPMPIVEVAIASGFTSASHFSKVYKRAFGCSPLRTREQNSDALVAAA